jgi:hypothetical protein
MLIEILSGLAVLLMIVLMKKAYDNDEDMTFTICLFFGLIFGAVFVISILDIIDVHTKYNQDKTITEYQVEYQTLTAQAKAMKSNYEDISKTTFYDKVTKYNKKVANYKYSVDSPFMKCHYSKKVADAIQYIELE